MKKPQYFLILLVLISISCKSETEKVEPRDTISSTRTWAVDTTEFASKQIINNFTAYAHAWGKFQNIAREMEIDKRLFEETGDNKFADRFNKLLPKYHRYGRELDSLKKLTEK